MRVLVIGASGQLRSELCSGLTEGFDVVPAARADFDIVDLEATRAFVGRVKPDVVINTTAYADAGNWETQRKRGTQGSAISARNVGSGEPGRGLLHTQPLEHAERAQAGFMLTARLKKPRQGFSALQGER